MTATALVSLKDISRAYGREGASAVRVLDGVTLDVAEGETLAVVGPSGCGKSTLLNIMGLLDLPDRGAVHLAGHRVADLDEDARAGLRNREIGFVFQDHHLLPQCTVRENVLVPVLVQGKAGPDEVRRADGLLERVGLADRAAHFPGQLSGGECQRVAVARALVNRARLVLADEPTGSLDEETASALADELLQLNRDEGTALVVVTHNAGLASRMGRTYRLHGGALQAVDGSGA